MTRGLPSAPRWAWVAIAGAAIVFVLLALVYVNRPGPPAYAGGPAVAADESVTPVALQRPTDRPLRVLFAGDSITEGLHSSAEETTFRALVTANLAAGGPVEPVRIGLAGRTTAEVQPDIPAEPFDLVIVELGTNDLFKSDLQAFRGDYPAFLDDVRAQSPDAALLCAGIWYQGFTAQQFDALIERECEERGGGFVSLLALYSDEDNRGPAGIPFRNGGVSDDSHPNDAGHAAIAGALVGRLSG